MKATPHVLYNGNTQTEYLSYTAAFKALRTAVQAWRDKYAQQTARKYYSVLLSSGAYDERYPTFELRRKRQYAGAMYIRPVSLSEDIQSIIKQDAQDVFLHAVDHGMSKSQATDIARTVVNGHGYTNGEKAIAATLVEQSLQCIQTNVAYCRRMLELYPQSETWQRRLDSALNQ